MSNFTRIDSRNHVKNSTLKHKKFIKNISVVKQLSDVHQLYSFFIYYKEDLLTYKNLQNMLQKYATKYIHNYVQHEIQ